MIDLFARLSDNVLVLKTSKHAATPAPAATQTAPVHTLEEELAFVSANQQLEGFDGKITEAVANHQPDMEAIAEAAQRFGAQVPTEENRKRPPLFPRPKA